MMCGFVGKFYFSSNSKPNREVMQKMTQALKHRGPDEEGFFFEDQIALGHRRLKVIDLITGAQPIQSACGRAVIVYNGEVYNFQELRDELSAKGRKFLTRTDTEVILNAYLEWGECFLEKLRGLFAFAIYDRAEKKLILARDIFGVKPLYYYIGNGWIAFASEMKSLLLDPDIPRRVDPVAIYQLFQTLYIPAPRSGVMGINKMPNAHCLIVRKVGAELKRYWRLPEIDETKAPDERTAQEMLFGEIERAVEEELISDVPLGVFLSGGLDSSTVSAAAVKRAKGRIKTYTVGFEEAQWDESKWAKAVAERLNVEHILLRNQAEDLPSLIEKLVWHFDEPHGNYTAVANYLLCQACKREITVALSGGGGDEIFAGYTHHIADKLIHYYYLLTPGFARKKILMPFFQSLCSSDQVPGFRRRLSRSLGFEEPDLAKRHVKFIGIGGFSNYLNTGELIGFDKLNAEDRANNDAFVHLSRYAREYPGKDKFNSLLWMDLNTYLCDDILLMTDRMSMANSFEVRVPLMDVKVVMSAFSIPFSYKLPGLNKKYILKQYLSQYLPRELIYRPKQGFGIPLQVWIKERLKGFFEDIFESDFARNEDFVSSSLGKQLLKEHTEQGRDHTTRIWTLAHYLLWKKTFGLS